MDLFHPGNLQTGLSIGQHAFSLWLVHQHDDTLIEILVCEERVLVEAMEVACSLGPVEVSVDLIDSFTASEHESEYASRHPGFFRYPSIATAGLEQIA